MYAAPAAAEALYAILRLLTTVDSITQWLSHSTSYRARAVTEPVAHCLSTNTLRQARTFQGEERLVQALHRSLCKRSSSSIIIAQWKRAAKERSVHLFRAPNSWLHCLVSSTTINLTQYIQPDNVSRIVWIIHPNWPLAKTNLGGTRIADELQIESELENAESRFEKRWLQKGN
jgi:hypothetical protein